MWVFVIHIQMGDNDTIDDYEYYMNEWTNGMGDWRVWTS